MGSFLLYMARRVVMVTFFWIDGAEVPYREDCEL